MHIYAWILAGTWLAIFAFCLFAKFGLRYAALFAAIQTAAGTPWSPLVLMGLPICFVLAYFKIMRQGPAGLLFWPRWAWLWSNDEDGVHPGWYAAQFPNWGSWKVTFAWTAVRNPVNNLRFVWGVSGTHRPLWYREFTFRGEPHYAKFGWMSDGYPAASAGAGKGF